MPEIIEKPVYPTLPSEQAVFALGKTMLPPEYWNQMITLLNIYRNTLLQHVN